MNSVFLEELTVIVTVNDSPLEPEEIATYVVRPVTQETMLKYKQFIDHPIMREVWYKAMRKESGTLSQGYDEKGSSYHTEGTNTMKFINREGVGKIMWDRIVTYARIMVSRLPSQQEGSPTCARITAGGNLLKGITQVSSLHVPLYFAY